METLQKLDKLVYFHHFWTSRWLVAAVFVNSNFLLRHFSECHLASIVKSIQTTTYEIINELNLIFLRILIVNKLQHGKKNSTHFDCLIDTSEMFYII